MALRGFNEAIVFAYSPLPAVSDAEILKMAGLDGVFEPAKVSPFNFSWKHAAGHDAEVIELNPGDFIPMRESEARTFIQSGNNVELGLVIVKDKNDTKEIRDASIKGLRAAIKFYRQHGKAKQMTMKKRHSLSDQELSEQRADYYPHFINEAKEKVCQAKLDELLKPKVKAA